VSRAFTPAVGGLYLLGTGIGTNIVNGGSQASDAINTRDLQAPATPDFVTVGPGSQVWFVGWSLRLLAENAKPANPLRAFLRISGAFDAVEPFSFTDGPEIRMPVYAQNLGYVYNGLARVEWPVVRIDFFNNLGTDLTIDFQFWGRAW